MILVRGGVVGKDVSMNYKMGEPFGEALSFGVLRKKRRVSGMMRAWNCNSLPDKNLSHVAAYTVLKYIIVSDSFRFLIKLWFTGKLSVRV